MTDTVSAAPAGWDVRTTVAGRFALVAAQNPGGVAIRSPDQSLTRRELDRWSNRVARAIPARADRPPVAVMCDEETETYTAALGAMKAGRPVMIVSAADPPARRDAILAGAAADTIVVSRSPDADLAARLTIVEMSDLGDDDRSIEVDIAPDEPALIQFTSGSTGKPKGVVHDQAAVIGKAAGFADALGITPGNAVVVVNRFLTLDVLASLLGPARMAPYDVAGRGIRDLPRWLRDERITVFRATPTIFRAFLRHRGELEFPDLRVVAVAGELLSWADVERLRAAFAPTTELVHFYGTGETGVATRQSLDDSVPAVGDTVPVGTPVAGVDLAVVDESGSPVERGEVGTIAVGGVALARGYLNRDELTAARFVGSGAARRFVTGDLGRIDDAGRLHFLGRDDLQVKVRGNRVELAEIEAALLRIPLVRGGAVVARHDDDGTRLVGYYAADRLLPPAALRGELRRHLPGYMIPTSWVRLESIPMTTVGKIDRAALPEPEPDAAPAPDAATGAPGASVADRMARLWREALGVADVVPADSFFDLGGDSLAAIGLLATVEEEFGRRIALASLFESDSLEAMCDLIERPPADRPGPLLVPLRTGALEPIYCIHQPGMPGGTFGRLAAALSTDHPMVGVVDDVTVRRRPDRHVTATADRYADAIAARSAGPYHLLGFSAAGVIAYETGRRLAARGAAVAFVGMIDTSYPSRWSLTTWPLWIAVRRHGVRGTARRVWREARRRLAPDPPTSGDQATEVDRLHESHMAVSAYRRYRVAPAGGPVTLFRAAGEGRRGRRSAARWRAHVDRVVVVPGAHTGDDGVLAAAHVDDFANALAASLVGSPRRPARRPR